ncbi:MAG: hypothetical protein IJV06_09165 [Bacteroidaceae bacterium]|nr:hypothetical protein [Bacteroidaceae bacterium]
MKRAFISISMMLMMLMANAQQVVNVEFLDGDLDNDDKITTGDVTGLIDYYLNDEEPRKTVTVTVDNSELEAKIARNTEWIDYFIKNQYDGINEDKVRKIVEEYMRENPGLSKEDVETIVKCYMMEHPGLTENDVEELVKYYGLTADNVKILITEWVYNHQILNKDEVNELINVALTNYDVSQQEKFNKLYQTIGELQATIEELKAEINNLKNASK